MKDRELDALVAEKVMGWKLVEKPLPGPCPWNCVLGWDGLHARSSCQFHGTPYFSTDIASAWMVVDRMVELGATSWLIADDEVYFEFPRVVNKPTDIRGGTHHGGEPTPLRICLAALKAVGVKVEDTNGK